MQEQKRNHQETAPEEVAQHLGETATDSSEAKQQLDDDVDAILDEIDEVLESNAEEFVKSYIQKGGQ